MSETIFIAGNSQGSFAVSATGAQSDILPPGKYDVWADVECFLKVGATASDVTASTGHILKAAEVIPLYVTAESRIGAVSAGTGTLHYHKVN